MEKREFCVIGITGGSGSGKTSIIKALRDSFSKKELCIISQDDYYRNREAQLIDDQGIRNFDLPTSIHADELVRDLKILIDNKSYNRQEYTFNNELAEPQMLKFDPAPVIIVEGLFVFHFEELKDLMDIKVFIEANDVIKVIRRIKRDRIERNYPLDDVLYRYENHVLPAYNKYILPYKEQCDLVINNHGSYEIGLDFLKSYISGKNIK